MAQYGYSFDNSAQADAASAAVARLSGASVQIPLSNTPGLLFYVDTDDSALTQNDVDTAIQNAIGTYKTADWSIGGNGPSGSTVYQGPGLSPSTGQPIVGTGTGPGQPGGFLDFGKTANELLYGFKNFVDKYLPAIAKPCDTIKGATGFDLCGNLWWILLVLIAIVIGTAFLGSFTKGLGEGVAARA